MNDNLSDLFPHLIVICKSKQHSRRGIQLHYISITAESFSNSVCTFKRRSVAIFRRQGLNDLNICLSLLFTPTSINFCFSVANIKMFFCISSKASKSFSALRTQRTAAQVTTNQVHQCPVSPLPHK